MGKLMFFGALDEVKVQKFVMSLSDVVSMYQHIKLWYTDLHVLLVLYLVLEIISSTFMY